MSEDIQGGRSVTTVRNELTRISALIQKGKKTEATRALEKYRADAIELGILDREALAGLVIRNLSLK